MVKQVLCIFILTVVIFCTLPAIPVLADTTTFTVNWNAGLESFAWQQTDACTGIGISCDNGRVSDSVISQQVLFISAGALLIGDTYAGYWHRNLTWQNMGVPAGATVLSVAGNIDARLIGDAGGDDPISIQIFDSANTTNAINSNASVMNPVSVLANWNNYAGSGSVGVKPAYQDYSSNVTLRVNHTATFGLLLSSVESRLQDLELTITYELPDLDQSEYRFFVNQDATTVGAALANQNVAPTLTSLDQKFRLRLLTKVSSGKLFASYESYKLQYVDKGAGTCAVPTGSTPSTYTDVTTSTLIAYQNNSPADGATLTTNVNDPTNAGGAVIAQTYEEANNFTNSVAAVAVGDAAMWDFALGANGAIPGKTFCLRVVKSTDTLLNAYTNYAQISTMAPYLTVDIVDDSGVSVSSPTLSLSSVTRTAGCRTSTGTFGINSQRIRVANMTTSPAWSLTLQASDGSTALWTSSGNFYDFNDPGTDCYDGGDSDSVGGKLSVGNGGVSVSGLAGCVTTGISSGSGAFVEGSNNAVTLATANSGASTLCNWELIGFDLTQILPGSVPQGTYSLNFVATIIAM